ncbi:hypothetical protein [Levilactobacillus tongjiangensis]|uniref:HTH marR-type domain-containing protein n=1 Tax=Levilactobacillus tongjiangensis TaxID=2486023 RepID=A0ABW1SQ36_9LACO|nr:hypothetical protein [Levilactobacillus tongjiangensis]
MAEFMFKNGIGAFVQRLNEVLDYLKPTEISLVEELLRVAVEPDQLVTMGELQQQLGVTKTDLAMSFRELVAWDLIAWVPTSAVKTEWDQRRLVNEH